eukprot:CAMPEP_0197011444 /NCGR_PEP_ID=MMETSP1380-20130617/58516_1 /TAXON_ID=5936 /ORGANISM="Euplotes crassus, Strain CT5" /LENGTH=190 /DNA_ID=CAMNT_0042434145 /DNA_START=589 /DNA_END=1161 /DNA_ORIENTATION=-
MKRHMKTGNREGAKIERQKMKQLRSKHGIYPALSFLNILQFPIHMVFISMINRLSYNYDIKPAILSDGFLWFQDLSSPDPYGILPIIGGSVTLLNIMSTSTTNVKPNDEKDEEVHVLLAMNDNPNMDDIPKCIQHVLDDLLSPPAGSPQSLQNDNFKKMIGIPKYLPGTKLERLNAITPKTKVIKPQLMR